MSFNVIALSGSLRQASTNTMALRVAQQVAPEGMHIEVVDLLGIPLFNEDVEAQGVPSAVATLKAKIQAADAVLISSPEYNFSISGVLKNALDWLSRSPQPPFSDKPVAIMGASAGAMGTGRMQYHLRQVMVSLNASVVNKPEVFISRSGSKFNAQGELQDEATAQLIAKLLVALQDLSQRMHPKA